MCEPLTPHLRNTLAFYCAMVRVLVNVMAVVNVGVRVCLCICVSVCDPSVHAKCVLELRAVSNVYLLRFVRVYQGVYVLTLYT